MPPGGPESPLVEKHGSVPTSHSDGEECFLTPGQRDKGTGSEKTEADIDSAFPKSEA